MKNRIYRHKIIEGASKIMCNELRYIEQGFAIKDGEFCLITEFLSNSIEFLKNKEEAVKNPILYQISIYKSNSNQEAVIYPSLLLELHPDEYIFEEA